jgi:membrane-associated protease RseP (regulator of RpoE activity)
MRTAILLLALGLISGCAYPRRSTMMHPAPASVQPQTQPAHLWSIRFLDAQLPELKGGGLAWDSDGTPPDPYVRLRIDGRVVWESPVQKDTLHPQWNVTLPRSIYVPPAASFRLELWDQDAASSDPAGVILRSGLPETALPNGVARLGLDNQAVVSITISEPAAFKGVGIEFEQRSDALVVLKVEPFSPAARASIKPGERIVAIGSARVEALGPARAASELSLGADRGATLTVADEHGKEREAALDRDFLWLTM